MIKNALTATLLTLALNAGAECPEGADDGLPGRYLLTAWEHGVLPWQEDPWTPSQLQQEVEILDDLRVFVVGWDANATRTARGQIAECNDVTCPGYSARPRDCQWALQYNIAPGVGHGYLLRAISGDDGRPRQLKGAGWLYENGVAVTSEHVEFDRLPSPPEPEEPYTDPDEIPIGEYRSPTILGCGLNVLAWVRTGAPRYYVEGRQGESIVLAADVLAGQACTSDDVCRYGSLPTGITAFTVTNRNAANTQSGITSVECFGQN